MPDFRMITKTIKTTGGPLKITIPTDISEITVGMLMALTPEMGNSFSQLEQLSILSGIPLDCNTGDIISDSQPCLYDICNMDDLSIFDEPLQRLAYQFIAFSEVQAIPHKITIPVTESHTKKWFNRRGVSNVKTINVISNLGIQPAGAYMEAKEVIKADIDEWQKQNPAAENLDQYTPKVSSLVRVLSLYLYCQATGEKFNKIKAGEFDEVVKKLYIKDALPIARYFFLKYPNLSKEKVKPSLESLKILRSKQA